MLEMVTVSNRSPVFSAFTSMGSNNGLLKALGVGSPMANGMIQWANQESRRKSKSYQENLNQRVSDAVQIGNTASQYPTWNENMSLYHGQFYAATLPLPWEPQVQAGLEFMAGEMMGGMFGWAGSATRLGGRAIVIGEGMDAVQSAAKKLQAQGINAKWYQAWSKNFPKDRLMTPAEFNAALNRNSKWINTKIKQGYEVFDIGIDPTRPTRSVFYQLEKSIIGKANYPVTIMIR